jgi:BlaI family penicillinase repressor
MKEIPRISEAEWEVMKVLWVKSPSTASQIIESLADTTDWKPKTVKTLISRLVKKDAIGFKQDNRIYYYYPLVDENECLRAEGHSFLNRVYGGALKPMLINFLREEKLSIEEIEELKHILDERNE